MTGAFISTARRRFGSRLALAFAVAVMVILVTRLPVMTLGLLERLELATLDYRFQYRGTNQAVHDSSHVVIVEISEESFRALPDRFPWPRSYYARLIRNLRSAGARAVGMDLIFSGSDAGSLLDDRALRDALKETGIVVLAGKREQDFEHVVLAKRREDFSNIFSGAEAALGLVNVRADADGVYRSYSPYYIVDSIGGSTRAVPTFGFAVLNTALGLPPSTVPSIYDGDFLYAGRSIPPYDAGSLLINYYGPSGTFPHIRFHDVLDDSTFTTNEERDTGTETNTFSDSDYGYLTDGTFRDKIVLVGVTVPEYKDLFPVPIGRGAMKGDNQMYGVELHANVVENVLRSDFLTRESAVTESCIILALVICTFFVTSAFRTSQSRRHGFLELQAFLFTAGEITILIVGSLLAFIHAQYVVAVSGSILGILGGYTASTAYHYVAERKQRMLIKGMFSTYVNPTVVEELIAHPERLVLGGRRQELTVLFSDLAGFTGISENLQPEELVTLLNEYMSRMAGVVLGNDGTLDKFIGDGVMAFWGAPIPQNDHPLRACMCALQMQDALALINTAWSARGRPALRVRIGINTGEMVVGNMGGTGKFAYTVIGDSVNIASRLEGANKQYGTSIMAAGSTFERVREAIVGRELDTIAVMGRSEPVTIYELMRIRKQSQDPSLDAFLETYAEGILRYRGREWRRALEAFAAGLALRPGDAPSQLYIERSRLYLESPPPDSWDGVFVMVNK